MADDPVENEGCSGPGRPGNVDRGRKFRAELGINLLREVEEAVCGPHVSEFPEVAEGLSLTTDRTAVICLKEDVPSRKLLPGVYHFQIPAKWSSFYRDSIMLAPVSFQEAVDMCLAAHTLNDWTRRPVVCIHREAFACSYGKIVFPAQDQLDSAARVEKGERFKLTPEKIIEQLEQLKELTGGDIGSVRTEGNPDAPIAVIIPGLAPPRLKKMLTSREDIKLISITLLNPFPMDLIMSLVGEAGEVVLMVPRKNPFYKRIFSNLSFYLGSKYRREVWSEKQHGIKYEVTPPLLKGAGSDEFLDKARFRLGVSSSGEGATRLLQEFAAACPVCRSGEFEITTVERCDLTVLSSGNDPGTTDCSRELDLLLVDLTEGKRAEPGLRLLSPAGHLVLIGDFTRLEGLAEDVTALKELRKTRKWKIWSGSERTDRADLVNALACLMFNDLFSSPVKRENDILVEISGQALEEKIRERKQALSKVNGSLRFPDEIEIPDDPGKWSHIISEFFLTGSCPEDIYSSVDFSSPALPAVLHQLDREKTFETGYPLIATRKNGITDFCPIREVIGKYVEEQHLSGLTRAFAASLEERTRAVCEFDSELVERALEIFSRGADIDEEATAKARDGVSRACSCLSDSARILTFSRAALPVICHCIVSERRIEKRRKFRDEVSMLSGQLGDLLQAAERKSVDAGADVIAGEIGEVSTRFLDPSAMVKLHSRHRASPGFSRERQEQLSWAYQALRDYLKTTDDSPEAFFVFDKYTYEAFPLPGVSVQTHENPFLFAAGIFDGLAERLVQVLKAVQLARRETETEGGLVTDSLTDKLDWTFLEMEELSLIPPVVVLISSESVFEKRLSSLGRLISSGRPVAVLVTSREFDVTGDDVWPKHSGISPDLGHLVLAFRELFAMQSSLALPMHTIKGLREWIAQPVPSVALVAVPKAGDGGFEEWWRSYAACLSRAVPCFRYDPSAGASWGERLDLEGNVLAEEPWIRKNFDVKLSDGLVRKMEDTITPAHAAVLKAKFSGHFLTIPEEAWNENQIEFREYLDKGIKLEPDTIPYIWILSKENVLKRAILTRDVVYACQERGRSWRMFQQLAGAGIARPVPEAGVNASSPVHLLGEGELLSARKEGAAQVIDRLVEILAGSSSLPQEKPPSPPSTNSAEDVRISETDETELPQEEQDSPEALKVLGNEADETEEKLGEDPYIESDLCNSCNDCINLNSSMFQYNSDKQAYIADPQAGTYKQLVIAAEKCPVRCIYPGKPKPGDETATEDVIARAKAIH
ncbi:MAG: ferredoxin [Acidobacteriota bacterium]